MPPRKKISAPAGRVYQPQQALQQVKFPERKKKVRSYGNSVTLRVPKLPKQETLTQMDFVKMRERELASQGGDEELEALDEEEIAIENVKPKRKRRRTMGDVGDDLDEEEALESNKNKKKKSKKSNSERRKTVGDTPSASSRYHTQTITQLDWSITSPAEEEPALGEGEDVDTSFDDTIFDIPSSSQAVLPPSKPSKGVKQAIVPTNSPNADRHTSGKMGPPQTPKRTLSREIPSSESPATPIFLRSGASERRSPLRKVPTNAPIPFNPNPRQNSPRSSHKLPRLEIQDTFDTATDVSQMTRIPTTPSKKSSPPKSVRFAIPEPETSPTEKATLGNPVPRPTWTISKSEIMDSDAESDDDYIDDDGPAVHKDDGANQPETCYEELGEDTQFEVERILGSPSLNPLMRRSEVGEDAPATVSGGRIMESPTVAQVVEESQVETGTADPDFEQEGTSHFEEKTQFRESQRLATQNFAVMAPRTINSDVFVSLPSQQVTDIIDRKRDHDIRNWAYPATVSRIWIYATKPVGALKYMAVISPAKRPGGIQDESGLGNAVFNSKKAKCNWHAYEILGLYELADPLPLAKLIEREWLQEAPKKHMPVRPAVLDSLMANLMPPIFCQNMPEEEEEEEEDDDEVGASSPSDTQEAEAQLLSTMKQFRQVEARRVPVSSPPPQLDERIPSSHEEMPLPPLAPPRPDFNLSQATTVDLTQAEFLSQAHTPRKPPPTREIIWESPTRPVLSSTPARLPTLRTRRRGPGSGSGSNVSSGGFQDSVVTTYSIASSQMLSKTQMEREGMAYDSIPAPPAFIQDSDDEDEDEDEA